MKLNKVVLMVSLVVASAAGCKKKEAATPAPKAVDKAATTTTDKAPDKVAMGSAVEVFKPEAAKPTIAAATGLFACKGAAGAKAPASKEVGGLPFAIENCPTIPSVYGGLAWGMNVAAVKQVLKGVKESGDLVYVRVGGSNYYVDMNDAGKAEGVGYKIGEPGLTALIATWGAPLEIEDLGDLQKIWFNPATKTKAVVETNSMADGEGDKYKVDISNYTPIADLLAADGILGKGIIGLTGEELQAKVPDLLVVKSAEQAKADIAAMGLDKAATDIMAWAGADQASARLSLPQPETDNYLKLSLEWADKKVVSFDASLSYEKNEAVKAEIAAVFAATLGAPTSGEQDSSGHWTYHFAGPNGHQIKLNDGGFGSWHFDVSK